MFLMNNYKYEHESMLGSVLIMDERGYDLTMVFVLILVHV